MPHAGKCSLVTHYIPRHKCVGDCVWPPSLHCWWGNLWLDWLDGAHEVKCMERCNIKCRRHGLLCPWPSMAWCNNFLILLLLLSFLNLAFQLLMFHQYSKVHCHNILFYNLCCGMLVQSSVLSSSHCPANHDSSSHMIWRSTDILYIKIKPTEYKKIKK